MEYPSRPSLPDRPSYPDPYRPPSYPDRPPSYPDPRTPLGPRIR
jgi:hypothetical protein